MATPDELSVAVPRLTVLPLTVAVNETVPVGVPVPELGLTVAVR